MKRTPLKRSQGTPIPAKVRAAVQKRSGGLCEVGCTGHPCSESDTGGAEVTAWPLELHHIVKRSQGGKHEPWNLAHLCRRHHEMTDAPYAKGRLVFHRSAELDAATLLWCIEVRERKGALPVRVLASGSIPL